MESRFSRQMKKGVLEMLVLGLVCEQPGHGHELLNRLAVRSGGFLHPGRARCTPFYTVWRMTVSSLPAGRQAAQRAEKNIYGNGSGPQRPGGHAGGMERTV